MERNPPPCNSPKLKPRCNPHQRCVKLRAVESVGQEIRVRVAVGPAGDATVSDRWQLDEAEVWRRIYRRPTQRERERWYALLLTQG